MTDTTTTEPQLTATLIADAVDCLGYGGGIRMYPGAYSGRGMYGKTCAAVEVDSASELVALGAAIAMVLAQEAAHASELTPDEVIDDQLERIQGASVDSLGTGLVIYWPSIPADA